MSDDFDQPKIITDVQMAFPASLGQLLPPWDDIPEEFQRGHTTWNRFVSSWFFKGWPADKNVFRKEGVDGELAFRHLYTILRSFEPKHEHKEAAVAWLMSRWYDRIEDK